MYASRRRLAAVVGAVVLATGAGLAGLATAGPFAAADTVAQADTKADAKAEAKEIVAISQLQGQSTQGVDCGPTSVVTALLAVGIAPRNWDAAAPVNAIVQARNDMQAGTGATNEQQVMTALSSYQVPHRASGDFGEILLHARNGESIVLAGNTKDLPWPVRAPASGVPHFLTVAGYDAATNSYVVLDPIASEVVPHSIDEHTLYRYFDNDLGRLGVLVNT